MFVLKISFRSFFAIKFIRLLNFVFYIFKEGNISPIKYSKKCKMQGRPVQVVTRGTMEHSYLLKIYYY